MIGLRVGESVREGIKCESLHFSWEIFPLKHGENMSTLAGYQKFGPLLTEQPNGFCKPFFLTNHQNRLGPWHRNNEELSKIAAS